MPLNFAKAFILALILVAVPTIAEAHTPGVAATGWLNGFEHPLHGWDHVVTMIAVGLWAAQRRDHTAWRIPVGFVAVMLMGSAAGMAGLVVPFVETAILVSVIVFAILALTGKHFDDAVTFAVVGGFAFFHGLAHGQEMPGSASALLFDLGFAAATMLLHMAGFAAVRLALVAVTLMSGRYAFAEEAATEETAPAAVPSITVYGRQDSLVGFATSATQGTVGGAQIGERPLLRVGEILETVPGIIITQHAGGGKANQYFLRGFNLDHGTDFATTVDGMPVNLPSHGHGQGYADLNFLIPELVQRVNYQKGVYYAANGDFSSAGAAHLDTYKTLSRNFGIIEGGMYGYGRGVAAASTSLGEDSVLAAVEVAHADGPWVIGDNYLKYIGTLTFSSGTSADGFSVTARGYHGRWHSSDQIAASAVTSGLVPIFGTIDPTDGGNSQRYSLQGEWHQSGAGSTTRIEAYAFYYDLNLFSNFTYFLTDPLRGDQFQQRDNRFAAGVHARHTLYGAFAGVQMETTVGLQVRHDAIRNGLYQTEARQRTTKVNVDDGSILPEVTRRDRIGETNVGLYIENKAQWTEHLRTVLGLREDVFRFDVQSNRPENTGTRTAPITSPKLSVILGPWAGTEFYLQGGLGYHSNDARGVVTHVDPVTGSRFDADGNPITPASPLVRTIGADIGMRTTALADLQSTLSLWWLNVDSELVFSGDGGTTEPSRPSRRYGIEFANYYTPVPWLTLDADLSLSHGEYRDRDPAGRRIPESIQSVVAAGITMRNLDGAFGSLRLRYFGPRPLIEDNSFRSGATLLLNGQVGYSVNDRWTIALDVLNILNRRDHDIDYAYESRITPTADAVMQDHFHPVEPRQVRVSVKAAF